MNNKPKKAKTGKKNPDLPSANEPVAEPAIAKRKRGRPKTSPHDPATQHRIRMQRYRDAKREGEEVPVEIYLPKAWHEWLTNEKAANLREVAVEAFSLWLKKHGYKGDVSAKPSSNQDA